MSTSVGKSVLVQGRIVWVSGDLFKGRVKTVFGTQQPKLNQAGEPIIEYGFGLAVPKSALADPVAGAIWTAMHEEAYTLYPSRQLPPSFAMKYKDGDGIDDKGQPFANREGYAGHLIFACTTTLPIKFFRFENGQNILINEGIKCGDYVNVQLNIKAHGAIGQGKPGLYLNPNAVQFLGYGKEIVNMPSGDTFFGTQAPAIPQGASATPFAPQPGQMLVPPPGAVPTPGAPYAAPVTQQAPPPNYGVIPQQYQPQQYQQAPTAAAPQPTFAPMPAYPGQMPTPQR
jgi:hypothetical protein